MTSALGNESFVLYEVELGRLVLELADVSELDVSQSMKNGRANFDVVQRPIADCAGLSLKSEGADSDLQDSLGRGYEVKSYLDPERWPARTLRQDTFHTAPSSLFNANNQGPAIKRLLEAGNHSEAMEMCRKSGYDKNDFYVYVNSGRFDFSVPLRYVILPTAEVLKLVSKIDPRDISRTAILESVKRRTRIGPLNAQPRSLGGPNHGQQ
jgi:hypothetical protein